MPPKTLEEQLAELEMEAEAPAAPPPKSSKGPKPARKGAEHLDKDDAALKELEELEALEKFKAPEIQRPSSRPNTPKVASSSSTSSNPRRIATPSSTGSARTSEDKPQALRKSGESTRSFHQSFAPTEEEPQKPAPEPEPKQSGGGWWGGIGGILSTATATANAAKKQAEAAYAEIQKNQEAQRWAEQVRGNVGALRGIGMLACFCDICDCDTNYTQAANFRNAPFPHLPTSCTRWPLPSHSTNVSRSTSHTTLSATPR